MKEPGAGELDRRVKVRIRNDRQSQADAGLESEFTVVADRWAKITALGTAIYTGAKQTGDDFTHRVIFRRLKGLDTRHEIVCSDGQVFRVRRATPLGGGRVYTVVDVEELTRADDEDSSYE
ncbi:head-tail adaptor protein [Pseudomonas helleri]|uniref:head-tail adaptor protein n=1 Tax=Pseudomonas helleri TaxID=1608996 RepID=UPI003FD30CBE